MVLSILQHNDKWRLLLLSEGSGFGWCFMVSSPVGNLFIQNLEWHAVGFRFYFCGVGERVLCPELLVGKDRSSRTETYPYGIEGLIL